MFTVVLDNVKNQAWIDSEEDMPPRDWVRDVDTFEEAKEMVYNAPCRSNVSIETDDGDVWQWVDGQLKVVFSASEQDEYFARLKRANINNLSSFTSRGNLANPDRR